MRIATSLWALAIGGSCCLAQAPEKVETVDLGLPSGTLWANMNLGANSVTDYGDYFAWGETTARETELFDRESDPFFKITQRSYVDADGFTVTETTQGYTKYVMEADAPTYGYDGFYDNKTELERADDAASAVWGAQWRMPTKQQWQELADECTWQAVTLNGINGYKVVGRNEKYIFLPKGGYCYNAYIRNFLGEFACYWSASLGYSSEEAYGFTRTGNPSGVSGTRWAGRLIRAVSSTHMPPNTAEKCQPPTISYENGSLLFSSETKGARFVYSITDDDLQTATTAGAVSLGLTYHVSVYATKEGLENSDVATATLCWLGAEPATEGMESGILQASTKAVMISAAHGTLTLVGAPRGTNIAVYNTAGAMIASAVGSDSSTSIPTNLRRGETALVKMGSKSVKVVMQ